MSEDQTDAAAVAGRLLHPGLSPQAFRTGPAARPATAWLGSDDALQQLGLCPGAEVREREFAAVLHGRHINSGVRVLPEPAFYNMVFMAPRSLSIAWSQLYARAQTDIEEAVKESVATMVAHLTRIAPLVDGVCAPRSIIAALVLHAIGTRSDDAGPIPPVLHVHCCLFAVQDNDGSLTAPHEPTLANEDIQRECDAIAAADLADRLMMLGYEVRNTVRTGTGHVFELVGVPQVLLDDGDFWRNVGCAVAGG